MQSFRQICFLTLLVVTSASSADKNLIAEGKSLVTRNCSRCHAIGKERESPLAQAPPLREIYLRYPIEQLSQDLSEGMGSRHREMPQIQFSADEALAILSYLGSVTGIAPSERITAEPEGVDQTEPP
jgi:mono/diheme cytochrome c family protein